ncbi:MAG: type II toxin-antitoxin system RelE/ParE family toxin [Planctomycetes bacterium]|nr:type II toxin-antitoxin system RelE/ParE family toxin [Planctomycetota bacterium]
MSAFKLNFTDDALDSLTWTWLGAKDRKAATAAQFKIEQALSRDPANSGQAIGEGLWRIVVAPLVAHYEIDDDTKTVTVTGFSLLS